MTSSAQLYEAQRQFERAPDTDDDLLPGEVDAWDAEAVQTFMCDEMGDFVETEVLAAFSDYVGSLGDRFAEAKFARLMAEMRLKVLAAIDANNEEVILADLVKWDGYAEGLGE